MSDAMPSGNLLRIAYARRFPAEVATHLVRAGSEETARALADLPAEVGAAVVARLPHGVGMRTLGGLDDERLGHWLAAAELDDALAILLHVDDARRRRLLEALPKRRLRRTLRRLVVFPAGTVGATLNPAATRLDADMTLGDAVGLLRGGEQPFQHAVWLVDEQGGYLGRLDLSRALMARSERLRLRRFLVEIKPLRGETTLPGARDYGEWLEYTELPVVDELGHFLGSISRARLMLELEQAHAGEHDLVDGVSELIRQYFRVMGICLSDLFGLGARR